MTEDFLTTGEFERSMVRLEQGMERGFTRILTEQSEHAQRIAQIELLLNDGQMGTRIQVRKSASSWGGIVAGVVMGVVELIRYFTGTR